MFSVQRTSLTLPVLSAICKLQSLPSSPFLVVNILGLEIAITLATTENPLRPGSTSPIVFGVSVSKTGIGSSSPDFPVKGFTTRSTKYLSSKNEISLFSSLISLNLFMNSSKDKSSFTFSQLSVMYWKFSSLISSSKFIPLKNSLSIPNPRLF